MTELNKWILNAVRNNQIVLTKLTWTNDLTIPFFDYQARLSNNLQFEFKNLSEITGQGSDVNEDLAIIKAVAELYERFVLLRYQIKNSNGCAAHTDKEIAQELARQEVLERDAFLFQFIHQVLPDDYLKLNSDFYLSIVEWSKRSFKRVDWRIAELRSEESTSYVYQSSVVLNSSAIIVGLGSDPIKENALNKAAIECARQLAFLSKNQQRYFRSYDELMAIPFAQWSFQEHGDLALTKEYTSLLTEKFTSLKKVDSFKSGNKNFDFHLYSNPSDSIFKDIPLYFFRAQNKEAIPLVCGSYQIEDLDCTRVQNQLKYWSSPCLHPLR